MKFQLSLLPLLVASVMFSACAPAAPSESAIQTALSETQAASTPTDTSSPTFTPLPMRTPRPTSTPRPSATPTPEPTPIVLSGTGDSVVDLDKWPGAALAHITYTGPRDNFAVINFGSNNDRIDLLVNKIGAYEGTVPLDFGDGEQTTRFQVTAGGPWKIEVLPISEIRRVGLPATFLGHGDDVILLDGPTPDTLKADNSQSDSNFAIIAYGNGRELLVNEIAPYVGTVLIPSDLPLSSGRLVLVVIAEGPWSLDITTR